MLTACPELLSYVPDTLKNKLEGLVQVGLGPGFFSRAVTRGKGGGLKWSLAGPGQDHEGLSERFGLARGPDPGHAFIP